MIPTVDKVLGDRLGKGHFTVGLIARLWLLLLLLLHRKDRPFGLEVGGRRHLRVNPVIGVHSGDSWNVWGTG